jgi:hypothetical protein
MADDSKDDSLTEALNVLGVKDVIPKAYEDLLQPAAQELGKSLVVVARAVSMALAPVEGAVWAYDRIRSWLSVKLTQKLAKIDDECIQPPPMNIAGPAILNLTFTGGIPALREMYANLLASSMDANVASTAHPAFVRIIEQLSPDEAKILGSLVHHPSGKALCHEVTSASGTRKRSEKYLHEQWDRICAGAGVEYPGNNGAYMDNLMRLRLIGHIYENKSELIPEGGNDYGTWESHIDGTVEQTLYLTEFGERFIAACVA